MGDSWCLPSSLPRGLVSSLCRELFQVLRGSHRDFTLTKHPGMPYQRIRFLHLLYPLEASPCNWIMGHTWKHWLDDVEMVRKYFPNLRRLFLKMGYKGVYPTTMYNYGTWAPLLSKARGEPKDATVRRMTAVLRAMTQLHGRKMPRNVQINFWTYLHSARSGASIPADHVPYLLNDAISKVADPNVDLEQYDKESYPLYWITGPDSEFLGLEGDLLPYEEDVEGEPSVVDGE
jgi:hypothetical protein